MEKEFNCPMCGKKWQTGIMCIECAKKQTPEGPPLKRLRRYGFKVSYRMRKEMRCLAEVCGSIPTDCEPEDQSICMSHLFVACDGKTYRGDAWITQGGSSFSSSEPYPLHAKEQNEV